MQETNETATTETAVQPAQTQAVREWSPFKGDDSFYCSLPAKSLEDKMRVFQLREGDHRSLQENVNLEIDLVHVLAHQVNLEQPGGEVIEATRCVLMDVAGNTYQCVSEGVRSSLETMFKLFGQPATWSAPIKMRITTAQTRLGRRIMKLVPILPSANGKPKK